MDTTTKSSKVAILAKLAATAMRQWWFGVGVLLLTLALVIQQGWLPEGTIARLGAVATGIISALQPGG